MKKIKTLIKLLLVATIFCSVGCVIIAIAFFFGYSKGKNIYGDSLEANTFSFSYKHGIVFYGTYE